MSTFAMNGLVRGRLGSVSRLLSAAVVAAGVFGLGSARLEATRECENPAYVPPDGACAHLPTSDLFYRDVGADKHGKAEAVIFLHAGSGNADAFAYQLAAFAKAGYRAIAYDRKNVARSSNTLRDAALGRSVGTTVQDLDDLATFLGIDRFHIVGIAAGGQVALQYAAVHPGRVLSLVLAATLGPPGLSANEPTLAALQANIALPYEVFCFGPVPSPLPAPMRLVSPTTTTIPEVRPEHRELGTLFRAMNRPGVDLFQSIEANSRHRTFDGCRFTNVGANQPGLADADPLNPNTYAKLAALVRQRTLLLAGSDDSFFSPPVHMRLWGSYIDDAQFTVMDAGHAPQFEDPETFNRTVQRFLKGGYPFKRMKE